MRKIKDIHPIGKDIGVILLSIFVAIFIVQSGIMHRILESHETFWVSSIIAGAFFTSIFTTAPAIVALGEISQTNSLLLVALFGAIGSVIGDMIIFRYVRGHLSEHIKELLNIHSSKRLRAVMRSRMYRAFLPFLGALIIASPLPDELGLAILGSTNLQTKSFLILSFAFNFFGILAVGLVARAIV